MEPAGARARDTGWSLVELLVALSLLSLVLGIALAAFIAARRAFLLGEARAARLASARAALERILVDLRDAGPTPSDDAEGEGAVGPIAGAWDTACALRETREDAGSPPAGEIVAYL